MTTSTLELSRQLLVGEMLKRASHKTPNAEAFIYSNKRQTFQELDNRASSLAGWLQTNEVSKDVKVGLMLKNSSAFVETIFAIPLSGGIGVTINYRLGAGELKYILSNSETKILFIDAEYMEIVDSIKNELPNLEKIVVFGADILPDGYLDYESLFKNENLYSPCEKLTDEDPCYIMYTSGTTGRPKGAVLTHKNITVATMNFIYEAKATPGEAQLICVPQFHIGGLLQTMKTCLTNGKTVIHREFNPVNVLKTFEEEKINTVFLVSAMWNFLFQIPNIDDYDVSSLKVLITAAAITPIEIKKKIMRRFENASLIDNFGQTEATITAGLAAEDTLRKTESVGKPYINVEVRIVDENMQDVPIGEVGEIVYRGPTIMKEYYKNPEATAEAFTDGWFHSGDLVRMDDEGFIYVVDRKKNMIISGGENIYPAEIEEVLYQLPQILECAVIGIPDSTWGESVKAYIVVKPNETLTEEQVINFCSNELASYKKPRFVEFIDELPRNTSGKVLKYALSKETLNPSK